MLFEQKISFNLRWKFFFNCGVIILKWWSEIQMKMLIQNGKNMTLRKKDICLSQKKQIVIFVLHLQRVWASFKLNLFFFFWKKKKKCLIFLLGLRKVQKIQQSQWVLSTPYLLPPSSGDSANLLYRSALICTLGCRRNEQIEENIGT